MDGNTGLTLFEPSDLKLNLAGNEEDDEEALEDQKRRDKVLKAQLEKAFDDWSDDEDIHTDKDRIQNSCNSPKSSTDDDDNNDDKTIDEARLQTNSKRKINSRGLTFQNLSDISEHSMNKSEGHSSDNSRVFASGTELSPSTGEFSHLINENGDFQDENQLVFKNNPHNLSNNKFVPIFIKTPTPSPPGIAYKQAVNGRVEFDKQNQQIFKNNYQEQTSEKFQPFFNNPPTTEQSTVGSEKAYKQAELSSGDQLEVLYQVRLKEIQRLDAQLQLERHETAVYKQQTMLKMALLQSDKERALLSRSEADKLLVASKDEITNLQKEVATLKNALQDVEKDKRQCDELLEVSRVQIEELQDSKGLMERCSSSMAMTKQTNLMVKSLKSKHQEELGLLQNQLESVTKKLLEKEEESSHLKQKLDQVTVEKAATISQLTRSLEDSQHQCQKLLESNVVAENVRLQHKLNQVLLDKEELSQTVNNLKEECRLMKTELDTLSPTDSMVQMGMISRSHSSERATNLQVELHRALLNQKAKRAEVIRLQEVVSTKEKEIAEIKRQQQMAAVEKEALNDELKKVKEELISMISKYEKMKEATEKKIVSDVAKISQNEGYGLQPEQENKQLLKNREMEIEADLQLKEMSVRLNQSLKESNELKEMYLEVTTELGMVKAQLQQVSENRDSLSKQLQTSLDQATVLHREKLELTSRIKELEAQLANICQNNEEEKLRQECTRLQQELTSMSTRHAQELSSARSELQATRDRVSQLEKTTRLQFETKIKTLHQEREMLKTKCDEKEVQIKKLIESRKRVPSTVSAATETDQEVDWEDRLERERFRCRQEYEAALALMEKDYQDIEKKLIQDTDNLRQSHLRAIDELQHQLVTIEDRTKEKTIHFFSEKIHELETKYQEELKRVSESSEVVRLKAEVADQSRQIEILSESLERSNESVRMRMKELAVERETERRQVALLMEQWSQEMKSTQEELKIKESNIKELKFKLESAKYCAKTNHDKLVKTNLELAETVNKKLAGYRAKLKTNIENYEKDLWEKVLKIETVYKNRERRLHQALKKQLMVEL